VFIRADGRTFTHANRMTVANVLRRAAAEARGEAWNEAKGFDINQALAAYAKVFPTGRAKRMDLTMADMRDLSQQGWFISTSGSMDDVPGKSPLDDYVSDYPHEIGIVPFTSKDNTTLIVEPMRPQGRGLVRALWSDVAKFSSEFATNGQRPCIVIESGYDTKAARVNRRRPDTQKIEELRGRLEEKRTRIMAQDLEIASLNIQLVECRENAPNAGAALDAIEEGFTELLQSVREDYA